MGMFDNQDLQDEINVLRRGNHNLDRKVDEIEQKASSQSKIISDKGKKIFEQDKIIVDKAEQISRQSKIIGDKENKISEQDKIIRELTKIKNQMRSGNYTHDEINSPRIKIVKSIGVLLIIVSLIFAYLLVEKTIENSFSEKIIWTIYLFSQFSGLYLAGFGKSLTINSLSSFSIYLSVCFLIVVTLIVLYVLEVIALNSLTNVYGLMAINSIGIPMFIYLERKLINRLEL